MPGKTSAAGHNWHVAETERVHVAVAELEANRTARLLGHSLPLRPLNEDQLRTINIMILHHVAIPTSGRVRPGGNTVPGDIVQWATWIINRVADSQLRTRRCRDHAALPLAKSNLPK